MPRPNGLPNIFDAHPDKREALRAEIAEHMPEIKAAEERWQRMKAENAAIKAAMDVERAKRDSAAQLIKQAIQDAHQVNAREHQKLRDALKDLGANPTTHVPVKAQFQFDELNTLTALQAAVYDAQPFPPDHLKQAWADLQARRSDKK